MIKNEKEKNKSRQLSLYQKMSQMYKLRKMIQDVELSSGPVWTKNNDSQLTTSRKFIRKTRLEETSLFLNKKYKCTKVLGHDPEKLFFVEHSYDEIDDYKITSLDTCCPVDQALQMERFDMELEKVKRKLWFDLYYIQNAGLVMDLKVIFRMKKIID